MTEETNIDLSLLPVKDLANLVASQQRKMKEMAEKEEVRFKELEAIKKRQENQIFEYREALNKTRFPGLKKADFPDNTLIAKTLSLDVEDLDHWLDVKPDKYLLRIEASASTMISALKAELSDGQVDVSGKSIIELMDLQQTNFWDKYLGSATIDEKYSENCEKTRTNFFTMKERFVIYCKSIAMVSLIQDCRMSAYLQYRERLEGSEDSELIESVPVKKDDQIEGLINKMEEMKKEIEALKTGKEKKSQQDEQVELEKEQLKLAAIGRDEVPQEPTEEEEEMPEDAAKEEPKKKKGRY